MRSKKWGIDIFPTLSELKIAENLGMNPSEYCTALNLEEEYQQQLISEGVADHMAD